MPTRMRVLQRHVQLLTRALRSFSIRFPTFSVKPLHKMQGKNLQKGSQPKRQRRAPSQAEGSNEEVLLHDVKKLLAAQSIIANSSQDASRPEHPQCPPYAPPERFSEVQVTISELSSTGDGLGLSSTLDHVYIVPFTLPGDVVKAKTVKHFAQEQYTLTDFVQVITPGAKRDDALVRCPYFSRCAGCQFQMLSYADQLAHKRSVIVRAYQNFSNLIPELVPPVGETIGSPLQYGYRTKLTPHFDRPPGSHKRNRKFDGVDRKGFEDVPPIGFMLKGTRKTIDIEDCPIGTDAVRLGMASERNRVAAMLTTFKKGVTLLLRESTLRNPKTDTGAGAENSDRQILSQEIIEHENPNTLKEEIIFTEDIVDQHANANGSVESSSYEEVKTCITDSNAISTEFVDDFKFSNPAGAFFQNNNSILPKFTAYIREHSLPKTATEGSPIKYLIDAYCGSGLFTITLSSLFSSSIGIDIAGSSVKSAKENAAQNQVNNASFITADASALFQEVQYPPDETVVVIDPPRKGCDDAFLQQLLHFNPIRVVYVSCNVHTQARDIGKLVHGNKEGRYEIESLRGFDFFPQTSHVEAVAILIRSPKTITLSTD